MGLISLLQSFVSSIHLPLLVGYLFGIVGAHFLIGPTLSILWQLIELEARKRKLIRANKSDRWRNIFVRYAWQTATVGFVERTMYIASLQIQRPEFIAVWLTLKTVVHSRRWAEEDVNPGRAVYNNFLIGNGLSILYSLAAALAIQWTTGPSQLDNYVFAFLVPLALVLLNVGLILWLKGQRGKIQSDVQTGRQSRKK